MRFGNCRLDDVGRESVKRQERSLPNDSRASFVSAPPLALRRSARATPAHALVRFNHKRPRSIFVSFLFAVKYISERRASSFPVYD